MKFSFGAIIMLLFLFSCKDSGSKEKPVPATATAFDKASVSFNFPSYDPQFPPPPGVEAFQLSQNYPDSFDVNEKHPWDTIDFKTDYKGYMQAVLHYCLEGNTEVDFKVQDNKVRHWYHAPWLHYGLNGREYFHGLTRERPVPPLEMYKGQNVWLENWAVGFYNQPGGYTLGKVWNFDSIPDFQASTFPEGTVSFKLLFTAGPVDKLPFLEGSKEWKANIYPCNPESGTPAQRKQCASKRVDSVVRLVQIDVAIKDKRAGATGWVFGTFIYDAGQKGDSVWNRIVPVGIMWGDDSKVDSMMHREGAFINPSLKETVLNGDLIANGETVAGPKAYMAHHGLGGRLNGPVDNPISSCISCHGSSAITDYGLAAQMANFGLTRKTFTMQAFNKYFATVAPGAGKFKVDTVEYNKLDYSLQLSAGIRNYFQAKIDTLNAKVPVTQNGLKMKAMTPKVKDLPEVTRNGLVP